MNIKIKYNIQDIEDSIDIFVESMEDLEPILRRFSAYKRGNVKALFKTEGAGKWKPLAASTVKKLETTGTSKVTAQGKLRSSYVKTRKSQLSSSTRAGNKAKGRAKGISSIQTFFSGKQALRKRKLLNKASKGESASKELKELESLYQDGGSAVSSEFKNLSSAKKNIEKIKSGKKVSIGKRAISKHKLLGKISSSIEAKISGGQLTIQSKSPWSEAQNDGASVGNGASLPARTFLEITTEDINKFAEIAEDYLLEKFGEGKKKEKIK